MSKSQKLLFLLMGMVLGEMFDEQFGRQARLVANLNSQIKDIRNCSVHLMSRDSNKLEVSVDGISKQDNITSTPLIGGSKRWLTKLLQQMEP